GGRSPARGRSRHTGRRRARRPAGTGAPGRAGRDRRGPLAGRVRGRTAGQLALHLVEEAARIAGGAARAEAVREVERVTGLREAARLELVRPQRVPRVRVLGLEPD